MKYGAERNIKDGAKKLKYNSGKNMKYSVEKYGVLCRKILNLVQINVKMGRKNILKRRCILGERHFPSLISLTPFGVLHTRRLFCYHH